MEEIKQAAVFVSRRIESLPDERRGHRSVIECLDAMEKIVSKGMAVQTEVAETDEVNYC